MAESFLINTAESVLGKLASLALQEFFLAWGLEDDLQKIKEMLLAIKAVLADAEQRQSQNKSVELWLTKLKDVLYDTEDVVDEFECEALRRQVVKSGTTTRKVRRFFSSSNPLAFRFRMGHKLKKIRERVAEIAALKSDFGLTNWINDSYVIRKEREMTHSFVDASDVIGRGEDKEIIIEKLLQSVDSENVSIIPIVGIGGLGKTTLAKLVYNDERVVTHFELKLWVCVSEDFDLQKTIIKILKSVNTDQKYMNKSVNTDQKYMNMDLDQLQKSLREALDGKKYLLILDDVWNEDPRKWHELETLLKKGANGSKIVVTTRSKRVASIMRRGSAYNLAYLPHQDCLSLFFKCAFREEQERQNPDLIRIGEEIVRKCKGVPLAVITLGTLLYSVTNERDWEFIRDSEIWKLEQKENDILPALRLSYEHMPSYLKRCFAYCSIFPKDYELDDFELVCFWMAQGLIQPSNENQELEDVGFRYFQELCSRCFFQDFFEAYGNVKCKMHDLIHDLALSVTQNECLTVISNTQQISKSVRHLTFSYPELHLPNSLQNIDNVRTISFLNERRRGINSECFIKTCFSRFQYLRFLDLSLSKFEVMPRSIGNLKHLRYLNLWGNRLIKRLSNSICKLQNLQTLILGGCFQLEELPKDIRYMINLRCLWITIRQKFLPMGGVGCLKSLRFLYITECENLQYLCEDMQDLKRLQRLVTDGCDSLVSLPPSMKCLTALETLVISNCENLDLTMEKGDVQDSNSQFSLRKLEIEDLPKLVDFPQWLLGGSTNSLKVMKVSRCVNLRELPDYLHNIASLEKFEIKDCPNLKAKGLQETGPTNNPSSSISL